jgi:hypothetical protein
MRGEVKTKLQHICVCVLNNATTQLLGPSPAGSETEVTSYVMPGRSGLNSNTKLDILPSPQQKD